MLTESVHNDRPSVSIQGKKQAAVIVGPPWPRSGTARVLQNQVEYYRARGYLTILICVPVHCFYTEDFPEWAEIKDGMREIGADHTFFAPVDSRRFSTAKYLDWAKSLGRGTALDWIFFTARSAQLPPEAIRLLRSLPIALVNVNHVYTFQFAQRLLEQIGRSQQDVPLILDTHDVQAHLLHERNEPNQWTHRVDSLKRLVDSELALARRADVLVHLSVDDFNFFKRGLPSMRHVLALPTIDESFVSSVASAGSTAEPIDLLFVGQSTDPNCAAMKWFFEEVWPLITEREYRIKIVGQIEALVRKDLPDLYRAFRSYFVGPVPDLAPYYRSARCVIAPMISGTGISIKTIEALALGKPFVGTSKAYRGMPMDRLAHAGLAPFDSPRDFTDAIIRTLADEQSVAKSSQTAYREIFSVQAAFAARDQAVRAVLVS